MEALQLRDISKSFGRNQVLFSIDFDLQAGEIHGIMGENGAGKSTLMNIIYGNLKSDGGEIRVDGNPVTINEVSDAQKLGMSDIFGQCDRVSVLRDGYMVSTRPIAEATVQQLVNDMAGREVDILYPPKAETLQRTEENVVLDVQGLTDAEGRFSDVNFKLYKGEILGFAGLLGAGRSEIMQGLTGLRPMKGGKVIFHGRDIMGKSTSAIFQDGLVMLPEDRKKQGLFLDMDIEMNTSAAYLQQITRGGVIQRGKERRQAEEMSKSMNVRCTGIHQIVRSLSGGNQQKVLLAKVLAKRPDVVIMDEPTRGVDVGAKAEIHRLLRQLASEGVSVIMVSSELNEVMGMSDRVVMLDSSGCLVGDVTGDDINSDHIMYYISDAYKYQEKNDEVTEHE